MKVSIVIATYNWPRALELCLKSLLRQSHLPDEVVIADDGSTRETAQLIASMNELSPFPLLHVWQEDEGFRLAQIRNKAFAKCQGDYIIQLDGDVLLHRHFIRDHLMLAKPGCFIQGSRVMLGEKISTQLLSHGQYIIHLWKAHIKRRENGLRMPILSRFLSARYKNRYPVYFARGANMSFWKKDLVLVNGYNEDFNGWGHEDSELTVRLMNAGKRKLHLKFAGIVYHLFHKESDSKVHEAHNLQRLEKTLAEKTIYTSKGLAQYV